MKKYIIRVILTVFMATGISGCMESSFILAPESRLPKWFDVPEGLLRNELKVTMDYYAYPGQRIANFTLQKDDSFFRLKKVTGIARGKHPLKLDNPPEGFPKGYPSYEVITVDGITDIIEHRKMEPVFYMTDDPAVWKEFGVEIANK